MTLPVWLVTGGAGFIGSNFVRWALEHRPGIRVVVLDKLTYAGSLENLRDLPGEGKQFDFIRGDIACTEDVVGAFRSMRPQRVLNFAAESHVDRSIDGPRDFIETNTRGCFELLEAARGLYAELSEEERSAFRFLQVSTDEVYGELGPTGKFTEETPYAPNSPYSASKAGGDLLVRAYAQTYGLPTITTQCSNNYGPFQLPEKLIPLMLLNALEGKPLPIYGDGSNVRDWIFVEDHCIGIARALEDGNTGECYAFGGETGDGDSERTNLEVIRALCEALEHHHPAAENPALMAQGLARYEDLQTHVPDRPGHDQRYAIDSSKAQRVLGWKPARRFDEGIRETVAWYLENAAWREAIAQDQHHAQRRGLAADAKTANAAGTARSAAGAAGEAQGSRS